MPDAVAETYREIPLKLLREAKWNPRKTFDEGKLAELAESIKAKGVIEPLVVREIGLDHADARHSDRLVTTFEIVCGARRFRAGKLAKLETLPCIVRDLSDDEALEFAVIENGQRADVSPLEEAAGYAALRDHHHDVAEIAAKIGKGESFVYSRLQLLKLVEPAQTALVEGRLSLAHANLIARLVPKDQAEALRYTLDAEEHGGALRTAKGLAAWIESTIHLDLEKAKWNLKDATLLPEAGACLTCTKRTGTTPGLFPDVKRRDTCIDRDCYAKKRAAWIEREIADEKESSGVDLVQLATGDAGVDWIKVAKGKKGCNYQRPAIVVEGFVGDLGNRFDVCTEPKRCDVHGEGATARGKGAAGFRYEDPGDDLRASRAERAAAEKKAKAERATRRAILDATLARVTRFDDGDLLVVAEALVERAPEGTLREIVRHREWAKAGARVDFPTPIVNAEIGKLGRDDLFRFILELSLARTLVVWGDGGNDPKPLLAAAKRHGVDVAEIRKAAGEEKALAAARKELKQAGKGKPARKARAKKGAAKS